MDAPARKCDWINGNRINGLSYNLPSGKPNIAMEKPPFLMVSTRKHRDFPAIFQPAMLVYRTTYVINGISWGFLTHTLLQSPLLYGLVYKTSPCGRRETKNSKRPSVNVIFPRHLAKWNILHETNSQPPLKIGRNPKGNEFVFQPSIFRCKLAVSFREGNISPNLDFFLK